MNCATFIGPCIHILPISPITFPNSHSATPRRPVLADFSDYVAVSGSVNSRDCLPLADCVDCACRNGRNAYSDLIVKNDCNACP